VPRQWSGETAQTIRGKTRKDWPDDLTKAEGASLCETCASPRRERTTPTRTPRGKTCDAIMGIIEEGQEVMKEFRGAPALDAGLLAAAQAVEHYEIARYGTLKTWAAELGLNQAVKLLDMTLGEEKKTDETLTKLAQSEVNQHAQAA
jgi:ferritin-like metal-binding protein YciE